MAQVGDGSGRKRKQATYAKSKVWSVSEIHAAQRIRGGKRKIRELVEQGYLALHYPDPRGKWYISEEEIRHYEQRRNSAFQSPCASSRPSVIPPDCRLF